MPSLKPRNSKKNSTNIKTKKWFHSDAINVKSSWPLQHDLQQIEHIECQHTGPIQEHPVSIWEICEVKQGSELQVEPLLCTGISTKDITCIISVTILNKLVQLSPSYNGKTKIFAQYPIAVLLVFGWAEIFTQAF